MIQSQVKKWDMSSIDVQDVFICAVRFPSFLKVAKCAATQFWNIKIKMVFRMTEMQVFRNFEWNLLISGNFALY